MQATTYLEANSSNRAAPASSPRQHESSCYFLPGTLPCVHLCLLSTKLQEVVLNRRQNCSPCGFSSYACKCCWNLVSHGGGGVHHSQHGAIAAFSEYGMSSSNGHLEWNNLAKESCWSGRNQIVMPHLRRTWLSQKHAVVKLLEQHVAYDSCFYQDLFAIPRVHMTRGKNAHSPGTLVWIPELSKHSNYEQRNSMWMFYPVSHGCEPQRCLWQKA